MKGLSKKTALKIVIWLWGLFGLAVIAVYLFFSGISKGWIGNMPSLEDIENPIDKFATQIISADGVVLGTFARSEDNRVAIPVYIASFYSVFKFLSDNEDTCVYIAYINA